MPVYMCVYMYVVYMHAKRLDRPCNDLRQVYVRDRKYINKYTCIPVNELGVKLVPVADVHRKLYV